MLRLKFSNKSDGTCFCCRRSQYIPYLMSCKLPRLLASQIPTKWRGKATIFKKRCFNTTPSVKNSLVYSYANNKTSRPQPTRLFIGKLNNRIDYLYDSVIICSCFSKTAFKQHPAHFSSCIQEKLDMSNFLSCLLPFRDIIIIIIIISLFTLGFLE